jgi:putative endonuclease
LTKINQRNAVGKSGEDLAVEFLRKQGLRVLARNYRTRFGELDVICRKGRTIVFVEVRSRTGDSGRPAEESLTPKKVDHLLKCAQAWLAKKKLDRNPVRFDLVAVDFSGELPRLSHYPAAFEAEFPVLLP